MIVTDGRRKRTDVGPANGKGQYSSVQFVNVIPDLEIEGVGMHLVVTCAVCDNPAPAGKYTCSPKCARQFMGRWSV